jgi:hypothetical protein
VRYLGAVLRYRRLRVLHFMIVFAMLLSACGRSAQSVSADRAAAPQLDDVPHVRDADDAGRFIAGLPGTDGSKFAALETTDAWKEHRRLLDEAWSMAENPLISGLREFQKAELNDAELRNSTVFYPFGGPDALTLTLGFPQSPVYVMVALEPAGTLPKASQIKNKEIAKYLAENRETVASELSRSFFITREMDRQFRGQVTDGLLLPILHLLVRTHDTILGFRYVRLDEQGQVIDRAVDYKAPTRYGNKGVEIEFRADADQSIHKLFYFSVNLSDERLAENQPFLTYLSRLQGTTTLLKATSYLTHHPEFSMIRDRILANSAAILQDDSGIPYRNFQTGAWKVQLYGEYNRPYGSFRPFEQPDLRKAYATGAKPLPLRLGYGYSKVASNLLLARRVKPSPDVASVPNVPDKRN